MMLSRTSAAWLAWLLLGALPHVAAALLAKRTAGVALSSLSARNAATNGTTYALCSVADGSASSSAYPCVCGTVICQTEELCTATGNACKGVEALLDQTVALEANITRLDSVLSTARKSLRNLSLLVGSFTYNVTEGFQLAASTAAVASANAEIGRETSMASSRVDSGVKQFSDSMTSLEGQLSKMPPGLAEVAANVSKYYLWAAGLKANITQLTSGDSESEDAIQDYRDTVRAAVARSLAVVHVEVQEALKNTSREIATYGKNLWWNNTRVKRPTRNTTIGGFPVAPRSARLGDHSDSDSMPGCHGCNY